ncbi:hypothetical protein F5876DRAFT_63051 [Lentinula aff. lateritia]|uniref:Uncharacterized protein n=1 Tax=Lentinula aff. lateritia TaxID=2804960 RepID=A0ACC1U8T2_9AGAR|nr:hypothetical protein F5876DRAFT_63051 [Lentinula aff. lateritia]
MIRVSDFSVEITEQPESVTVSNYVRIFQVRVLTWKLEPSQAGLSGVLASHFKFVARSALILPTTLSLGINHSILPKPTEKAHSLLRSNLQEPSSDSSPHASPPNPPRLSFGLETVSVDRRHWNYPAEEERLESRLPSHSNTHNSGKDRWYTNTQIVNPEAVVGYPDPEFIDSLERLPRLETESQSKFPSGNHWLVVHGQSRIH